MYIKPTPQQPTKTTTYNINLQPCWRGTYTFITPLIQHLHALGFCSKTGTPKPKLSLQNLHPHAIILVYTQNIKTIFASHINISMCPLTAYFIFHTFTISYAKLITLKLKIPSTSSFFIMFGLPLINPTTIMLL